MNLPALLDALFPVFGQADNRAVALAAVMCLRDSVDALFPPSQPDFQISASPSVQNVSIGAETNFSLLLTTLNGFNSPITLSITGLPQGATYSLIPNVVNGAGSSLLMIQTSGVTPAGTYVLTITATNGQTVHTATVVLTVS